jgi:hypothetical protein
MLPERTMNSWRTADQLGELLAVVESRRQAFDDVPLRGNQHVEGEQLGPVEPGEVGVANGDRVGDALVAGPLRQLVGLLGVDGHCQQLHPVLAVLGIEGVQLGNLEHAGRAPGRPEVEQHGLAAQVGERDGRAVDPHQLEVGRGLAGRRGLLDAAGEYERQQRQRGARGPHRIAFSICSTKSVMNAR